MPRISRKPPPAIALLIIPLACLGLGGCGSSSGGSSSSASTPAATSTTAKAKATPTTSTGKTSTSTAPADASTEPAVTTARQFELVYECLRRNGVKLLPFKEWRKKKIELKINTETPQFKAKSAKCRHEVLG